MASLEESIQVFLLSEISHVILLILLFFYTLRKLLCIDTTAHDDFLITPFIEDIPSA